MAIKLTTTAQSANFVKMLVYGVSGVGKTTLCKTAPNPIIISAEKGLLSLSDQEIPVIEIANKADFDEAIAFLASSDDAKQFETVCFDSISDIAEACLALYMTPGDDGKAIDGRNAYGKLNTDGLEMMRTLRDIPNRHVYVISKAKRLVDDSTGLVTFIPGMPGQTLGPEAPYKFDFVCPLKIGQTNVDGDMVDYRYLQTVEDFQWIAKDRSGKLDPQEEPNLTKLFAKALDPNQERR